jgi:dienelactone hydrolase
MTVPQTEPYPISFFSGDSKLQGWFYPAAGTGPFVTAILLHGFPPYNQDVRGLGGRMMKDGINALVFDHRGVRDSEGVFTHQNALADVSAAIAYIRSTNIAEGMKIDTSRIVLAGYSFGGGLALIGSLTQPSISKVVSIAGANLGELARQCLEDDNFRKNAEINKDEEMGESGMVRGLGGKAFVASVIDTMDKYDWLKYSDALADKDILLVGGWRDPYATIERFILPIYRALQNCGAKKLNIEVYDTDHSFLGFEEQLAQRITSWIMN